MVVPHNIGRGHASYLGFANTQVHVLENVIARQSYIGSNYRVRVVAQTNEGNIDVMSVSILSFILLYFLFYYLSQQIQYTTTNRSVFISTVWRTSQEVV